MTLAVQDLRSVALLADVAPEALERLARATGTRPFARGDEVLAAGAAPESFLLLLEGELEGFRPDSEEPERVHVGPTYLGAISVLTDTPWPISLRARTPAEIAFVPADAFLALLAQDRRVQRDVTRATLTAMRRISTRRGRRCSSSTAAPAGAEGLDTARRIVVDRHRGRLELSAGPDGGALARVTLPG